MHRAVTARPARAGTMIALALALATTLAAAGPAAARRRAPYCAAHYVSFYNSIGHRLKQVASSGGVRFYKDLRGKDFYTCSDSRRTSADGQTIDGVRGWRLLRFVGANGRCAIAVLRFSGTPTYGGGPIANTVVAEFRLISRNGLGFALSATPGSRAISIPVARITSNCFGAWAEVVGTGAFASRSIEVANIGNAKVFSDPSSVPIGISIPGAADVTRWGIASKGRGALVTYRDNGVRKTRAIPAG